MRPDIMMVDLTTNDFSRAPKKRKGDSEQATIKDMIGRKEITILAGSPDTFVSKFWIR